MSPRAESAPGYRSAGYAAALRVQGTPVLLGATGGWVFSRPIAGTGRTDLVGPYPLFCCADWSALRPALSGTLPLEPVTATLVTEPFCPLSPNALADMFDVCRVLHNHWLIDLTAPLTPSRHHRRKLKRAQGVRIEAAPADPAMAADWVRLYGTLVARKRISDLRAFSADSLSAQLGVPGAHLVSAWEGRRMIGADLYYVDGPVAYAHLSAYAPEGYARAVSYPMIAVAAEYFRVLADVLDLGGAPAAEAGHEGGGVAHFKRGWTTLTRPSYLCGKIFDAAAYARLSGGTEVAWFPAYRNGEFAGTGIRPSITSIEPVGGR